MSRRRLAILLVLPLIAAYSWAMAQTVGPYNERDAKRQTNVQDIDVGEKLWVLDFRFKDPRLITVDIPGRGKKVVWYLWYQVINNTGEPRYFIPNFELVTLDKNTIHRDQILPKAEEAIKRIEDPTGYLDIKNSVTIAKQPIPVTKPNSAPRPVTGIAVWDDIFGEAPDTTRFSIFVSGLSNGYSLDDKNLLRRKTLQLNFKRLSDRFHPEAEVKFISPSEWLYRASPVQLPEGKVPAEGKAMEKEAAKEKEKDKE
ncbi:MAG: hypothetical protein JNM56_12775 [Planctomycetia bacterium]|nr:hypothetical protein [Planctomycetia bacterium]